MVELKKQVEELQEKHVLRTPPEVLEERSKATSEAVVRIRKGEKICTETVEAIFAMWESLLEDDIVEKIREDAWKANEKIIVVKTEMKKFPLKDKVTKMAEIKQLQQEVQALCDQERTREAEMEERQLEAVQLTLLIQHVHQKLQHIM